MASEEKHGVTLVGPVSRDTSWQTRAGEGCARDSPGQVLSGDRNFSRLTSPTWRADLDAAGCGVVAPPPRRHAAAQDPAERAFSRSIRNRIETLIGLLKGEHGLEDHGARSWWGLRTRLAGILAAYTIGRYFVATFC